MPREAENSEALQRENAALRAKLACLCAISRLIEEPDISLDEILQQTANLLPKGWWSSEDVWARITLGDRQYQAPNHRDTPWKQATRIVVHGRIAGAVEVGRAAEPAGGEQESSEEQALLEMIAARLGRIVERHQAGEALVRAHAELEQRVRQRTSELEAANRGLQQEIANRRIVEEELARRERWFRSLIELGPVRYSVVDSEGRILYASPLRPGPASLTPGQVAGRSIFDFVLPEDRATIEEAWRRLLRGPETPVVLRAVFRALDGTDRTIEHMGMNLLDDPVVRGVVIVSQDVTERVRTEHALQESERRGARIERAAATGQLAARIAHEINNPLAGVVNSFRLVKSAIPEGHPYMEFAEIIEKELRRIADIVRQMYRVHRSDEEAQHVLYLPQVITETLVVFAPEWRQKQIRVESDLQVPRAVPGVPDAPFRQIAFNLLKNAVEASPPGGTVKVEARIGPSGLEFAVIDYGPGVPPELRDRVFEPFFTTKRDTADGLGLGLSISKRIAESLQGTLRYEETPGGGATFRLFLPCCQDQKPN